ncbi:hypothetical protein WH95_19770 [Kiloniella litopenaei]|uniref:HEPN AbiU2-like domain-containing protein n=1 Tax=Kiloniella litopenaei TaxID=1549748 RepID=A0A0M2R6P6_9PROT|nr:hypothetical protein [Kiloniella litopenaei]KKJ75178.1 hypothetical protein WH95_19770 [Kiloniella litopenaei]
MSDKFTKRITNFVERVERIDQELHKAIRLRALHEYCHTDERLNSGSSSLYFTVAFKDSADSLIFELVMILMRVWDRGKKVNSIPSCFDAVVSQDFEKQLLDYQRQQTIDYLKEQGSDEGAIKRDVDRLECCISEHLTHFRTLKPEIFDDDIMVRLKFIRDKYYAHSQKSSENFDNDMHVEVNEVYDLLDKTCDIAFHLYLGAAGCHVDYKDATKEAHMIAKTYWSSMAVG